MIQNLQTRFQSDFKLALLMCPKLQDYAQGTSALLSNIDSDGNLTTTKTPHKLNKVLSLFQHLKLPYFSHL